jgi:hypothetical protein
MKAVITGKSSVDCMEADGIIERLEGKAGRMRLVHDLERLCVAAAGLALLDAGLTRAPTVRKLPFTWGSTMPWRT